LAFTIYPAIDLRAGRCVRLRQGRSDQATVFSDDPVATARQWTAAGASWLHVVILDGAFGEAAAANEQAIAGILGAVDVPVQLGGGLRDLAAVESALALGVARVVLGTVALTQPQVVGEAVRRFGPERVAVGIDARDGMVALRGWQETSAVSALDLACRLQLLGVRRAIYTDIARDGMLSGPNLPALRAMAGTGLGVIASGGIACLEDLRAVAAIAGVDGAIVGMALYTGAIDLPTALRELASPPPAQAEPLNPERAKC
jgi:phosphoribosylformimino-5-aminoimidazole carboxamide ribotide isomerase